MTRASYERLNRISLYADGLPIGDRRDFLEKWIDDVLAKAGFNLDVDYPTWDLVDCDTTTGIYRVYDGQMQVLTEYHAITH